jgi:hypothetical protein
MKSASKIGEDEIVRSEPVRSVPRDVTITRGRRLGFSLLFAQENAVKTPWRISDNTPAEYGSCVIWILW